MNDDWGDYGFYSYGAGPHQAYTIVDGRAVASVWRYTTGVEYGFGRGAWLGYLRSGDRRFYETAAAHTRYLNDVMLCHETGEFRHKGNWAWYSGTSTIPWTGPAMLDWSRPNGHHRSFGMFIEHALLHYYLTGDSRSLEVVREYAAALRKYISSNKDWAKKFVDEMNDSGSRWAFQRLDELAVLYEQFGDPWFLDQSIARDLRWFPDRWMHIALVWYKTPRGFHWRLFIDGKHGDPRRLTGDPGVFELPRGFKQLLIGAGGDARRPGALDVVIDDLRLSSVARYKLDRGSDKIAAPPEFAVDEHTLGLFRKASRNCCHLGCSGWKLLPFHHVSP